MAKNPLTTQLLSHVERTFHKFITDTIKEHVVDFTVLYVQRNAPDVDRASMAKVLDIMRLAIDDGYFKYVDSVLDSVESKVEEVADAADPLDGTELDVSVPASPSKPKKTSARNKQ